MLAYDLAFRHNPQVVAYAFEFTQIVTAHYNGSAEFCNIAQDNAPRRFPYQRVQSVHWLVQQQNVGARCQRQQEHRLLLHAFRELAERQGQGQVKVVKQRFEAIPVNARRY